MFIIHMVIFLCENVLNGSHETDDSREELNAWDCCHVPNVGVVDVMWRSGLRKLLRSRRLSEATYKLPHWIIFGSFLLQSVCVSLFPVYVWKFWNVIPLTDAASS